MQEKYGFVYIWYDRKRKMYYIGSHWGTEDDGYICSSNRMRDAYRRRPKDFKRRILTLVYDNRGSLLEEEQRWFDMVKKKDRYYNLQWKVQDSAWWTDPYKNLSVGEKISQRMKGNKNSNRTGKLHTEESKAKISKSMNDPKTKEKISAAMTGRTLSDETKAKIGSASKGRVKYEYSFISPTGEIKSTRNLRSFSLEQGLERSAMYKLANGSRDSYKGWVLSHKSTC